MKTLKCDLCDHSETAETFEEWMRQLQPHYIQSHADVMADSSRGKEEMMKWMEENKNRFQQA